jgi:preprotein translocase subunit YajC
MFDWFGLLLAQAAEGKADNPGGSLLGPLMPMVLIGIVFYLVLLRPQRREKKRRDDLLKAIKKNDRVVTIGGIIGTVSNIPADGKEVTLKVDDNTRIRVLRSSIQTVLGDEAENEPSK